MENSNKNKFLGKKTYRTSAGNSKVDTEVIQGQVLDVDLLHSEVDPPSDTGINPHSEHIPSSST